MSAKLLWPWDARAPDRFQSIQALRGIAVLLVVIYHAKTTALGEVLFHLPIVQDYGYIGVRLFFVISGFIIADRLPFAPSYRAFFLRRYLRIFPLYALATLTALLLAHNHGGTLFTTPVTETGRPFDPGPFYFVKSLLIIPQDAWPYLAVGWSLEFEIVFYALFGFLYFALGWAWASSVFILLCVYLWDTGGLGLIDSLTMFLYFSAGIIARLWLSFSSSSIPPVILAFLGFAYTLYEMQTGLSRNFVPATSLGFAGTLVFLVQMERTRNWFQKRNWLVVLGDMSFALYLTHYLFIVAASVPFLAIELSPLQAEGVRLAFVLISIFAGYLVWFLLERPINRLVHELTRFQPKRS